MPIKPNIHILTKSDIQEIKHIYYGVHQSPIGLCLVTLCEKGVLSVGFYNNDSQIPETLIQLKKQFSQAVFSENNDAVWGISHALFSNDALTCTVCLNGTPFQVSVWKALLNIPNGMVTSYAKIAEEINQSTAYRAVGTAIGANQHAVIIPCHRVIQKNGNLGDFRWGIERKEALLKLEKVNMPMLSLA